jgi:hypothetical protein
MNRGEQALIAQARHVRVWKAWHQEQLDEALAGAHSATIAELVALLDRLEANSAAPLLDFMRRIDWISISYDVRLTALHQINQKIMRLRERAGLPPLDDPVPGQADNVFRRVRSMLLAPSYPF